LVLDIRRAWKFHGPLGLSIKSLYFKLASEYNKKQSRHEPGGKAYSEHTRTSARKNLAIRSSPLAKPNFNFQKRQREIAKQKKNEEKKQRKLEKNATKPAEDQVEPQPPAEEETK
jgi:hypothetical protein